MSLPILSGCIAVTTQFLRVWHAAIEAFDLKLEHEEVIDFGDRVARRGRMTGQGTTSGITVNEPLFQLLTLRRGMVIRQEDFVDRGHALEAAGLSEQPLHDGLGLAA